MHEKVLLFAIFWYLFPHSADPSVRSTVRPSVPPYSTYTHSLNSALLSSRACLVARAAVCWQSSLEPKWIGSWKQRSAFLHCLLRFYSCTITARVAATLAKASRHYQRAATLPQPAAAGASTNYCWVHANAYFWLNMYAATSSTAPFYLLLANTKNDTK